MSAGQRKIFEGDAIGANGAEELIGEFDGEGGVVTSADGEDFLARAVQATDVGIGADGGEVVADVVAGHFVAESLPDIGGGQTGGEDVAEVSGDVKEGASAQCGFVGHGEKGEAGADTGADDAESVVALAFEPAQRALHVQHCLTISLQRETDIGATEMVGARVAGDRPTIMIREAEFDGGDSELVQPAADVLLFFPARIPLG